MKKFDNKSRKKHSRSIGLSEEYAVQARKDTYDWIQSLLAALAFCVILFVFFIRLIYVNGNSMNPSLKNGNLMLVSGCLYEPEAGDVVVFKKDEYNPNKALVKRVIATEGQVVNIDFETGEVVVDGVALDEDYISELTHNKLDFIGPQTVPEGCVFVLGDNRNASTDSRKKEIGMVDKRLIIGKAYMVIYPLDEMRSIK